jgi:hypothetical protein
MKHGNVFINLLIIRECYVYAYKQIMLISEKYCNDKKNPLFAKL